MLGQIEGRRRRGQQRMRWLDSMNSGDMSSNFYATGETNLFIVGKNVLTVMVPILINKDVFEPSYNDLNLWVQNRKIGRAHV